MKTIEDMMKMPLNQEQKLELEQSTYFRRVPGGWIYEIHHESMFQSVFVPEPERVRVKIRSIYDQWDRALTVREWVATKEMISSIIFEYEYDYEELEKYVRPPEEACNALAESIMEKLGIRLTDEG